MPQHNEIERRYVSLKTSKLEIRAGSDGVKTCKGYAAVFNSMSEDLGWYREILMPGCFKDALSDPGLDTVALFNHNPDLVLARAPGTLRMREDDKGLYCEMDLVDTQVARDCLANIEAGNVYQMSFAFTVKDAHYETVDGEDVRYIDRVSKLYDVSPVTYPAYKATSISARSLAVAGIDFLRVAQLVSRAERGLKLADEDICTLRDALNILGSVVAKPSTSAENTVAMRSIRAKIIELGA